MFLKSLFISKQTKKNYERTSLDSLLKIIEKLKLATGGPFCTMGGAKWPSHMGQNGPHKEMFGNIKKNLHFDRECTRKSILHKPKIIKFLLQYITLWLSSVINYEFL